MPVERSQLKSKATYLLEVDELTVDYGGIRAVRGVGLRLKRGELVALVGSNGAGKSSLLNAIAGLGGAVSGRVSMSGRDLSGMQAYDRVRQGLILVPEERHLFPTLSVKENLTLGAFNSLRYLPRLPDSSYEEVFRSFPVLRDRMAQRAGTLSGGEQQMLCIGRALMASPVVLILDEPSIGLAPRLVAQIMKSISDLQHSGVSIVLSEQNARAALSIADRGYVMEGGRIVLEGSGSDLLVNSDVLEAYLGGLPLT